MAERIHHLLDRWLAEAPARPFIHLPDGRSLSFADLGALTDTAEAELRALDVRRAACHGRRDGRRPLVCSRRQRVRWRRLG